MNVKNILAFIICIAIPQLAGGVGALFTSANIPTWYASLARPDLAPPNWVFGPVWTILFLLMGIALFIVWRRGQEKEWVSGALALFATQLVLNVLWSILFFGLRSPGLALIEIGVLWLAILATIFSFSQLAKTAGLLLVPYLLWVSFAAYLNYGIWSLN